MPKVPQKDGAEQPEAAKPKKAAKKPAAKKAAKKPAAKKAAKKEGVRWSEKRVAIVQAMRRMKAVGAGAARSSADIAEKAGLDEAEVKHYCYKEQQLVQAGLVAIAEVEGEAGLHYYLTAAGSKAQLS